MLDERVTGENDNLGKKFKYENQISVETRQETT